MSMINNWEPETRSLLEALIAAGVKITSGDNGAERFSFRTMEQFISDLTACDESWICVVIEGREFWLYLVLGNEPGLIVCDYVMHRILDEVVIAHGDKWEGKPQPMKEKP